MARVYKILGRDEWAAAQEAGSFAGSAVDRKDGYIHLSSADQAQETARLHFRGRADLVLLEIDAEGLKPALKWEPSRGGALFPHLYGTLPAGLVAAVREVPLAEDGTPDLGTLTA